jgi:glycosyltransferase involved in cell wall biosynthesis
MLAWTPSQEVYERLLAGLRKFRPDWILFDSWPGYLVGLRLSRTLGVPLLYRSCNVEYIYLRNLARLARGLFKIKLAFNALRMIRLERRIRTTVDLVVDIAPEDAAHWSARGGAGTNIVVTPIWLDPLATAVAASRDIDVLFVGNLRTANNLAGLSWFVGNVLPLIRLRRPGALRVVFAGSAPDPRATATWAKHGVECVANPADVVPLYARARVVINPLQHGGGVNIKMMEILANASSTVTTRAGFRGLPDEVREFFSIADTPEEFAAAVSQLLDSPPSTRLPSDRATMFERFFGASRLSPLVEVMQRMRAAHK